MTAARVVVVGSGIAGASTAFALAASGAEVHIVDAALPGQATAAGAGIIEPWSSMPNGPSYELAAAGAEYYPVLLDRLAAMGVSDVGYRASGGLVVDVDRAQLDEVEKVLRQRTSGVAVTGFVQRLDEHQARALFPPLAEGLSAVLVSGARPCRRTGRCRHPPPTSPCNRPWTPSCCGGTTRRARTGPTPQSPRASVTTSTRGRRSSTPALTAPRSSPGLSRDARTRSARSRATPTATRPPISRTSSCTDHVRR